MKESASTSTSSSAPVPVPTSETVADSEVKSDKYKQPETSSAADGKPNADNALVSSGQAEAENRPETAPTTATSDHADGRHFTSRGHGPNTHGHGYGYGHGPGPGPHRRGGAFNRGGRSGSLTSKGAPVPQEDFDFDAMNEKFEKQHLEEEEKLVNEMKFEKKYDKSSSFFDNLAPEKEESRKDNAGQVGRTAHRGLDYETFGEVARPYRGRSSYHSRGGSAGYNRSGSGSGSRGGPSGPSRGGSRPQTSSGSNPSSYSSSNRGRYSQPRSNNNRLPVNGSSSEIH